MKYFFLFSVILFLMSCNTVSTKQNVIGIQGYGNIDQSLIRAIKSTIEEAYDFEDVVILNRKPIPKSAFIHLKSPRYRADSILRILKRERPDTIDYVLGILNKDISTTKRDRYGNPLKPLSKYKDWGVFGLGYQPGVSCVLSTHRIKSADESKFLERMKKICIHEIGHNLGLEHCTTNEKCVMRDAAETIKTIDRVDLKLCDRCLSLIR